MTNGLLVMKCIKENGVNYKTVNVGIKI